MSSTVIQSIMQQVGAMGTGHSAGLEKIENDDPNVLAVMEKASNTKYTQSNVLSAFNLLSAFDSVGGTEKIIAGNVLPVDDTKHLDIVPTTGQYDNEYGIEALTGTNFDLSKRFTLVLNLLGVRDNQGIDQIFPTIMLPCGMTQIDAKVTLENIIVGANYNSVTGKSTISRFNLSEIITDSTKLERYTNRLYPISRTETDSLLLTDETKVVTQDGVELNVAPIKIKKPVNLLEITQKENMIGTNGGHDFYSKLDAHMRIEAVYIYTELGGGVVIPTGNIEGTKFIGDRTASDFGMNFAVDLPLVLNASTIKALTNSVSGIAYLNTLNANLSVLATVQLSGTVNVETGVMSTLVNDIIFDKVVSADPIATPVIAGTITDAQAFVTALTVEGYDVKVFGTDDAQRNRGLLTQEYTRTMRFTVPQGSPITKLKTNFKQGSCESDSDIETAIRADVLMMKAYHAGAVFEMMGEMKTALQYAETLDASTREQMSIFGIGRFVIKPAYASDVLILESGVTTHEDMNLFKNNQSRIIYSIQRMIDKLDDVSEYALMKSQYEPDFERIVYLWTPINKMGYLRGIEEELNRPGIKLVVVPHYNKEEANSNIRVMFGTANPDKTTTINMFQAGNLLVVPSLVAYGPRDLNGANVIATYTIPRYLPILNHPVLGELSIVTEPLIPIA